MLAGLNLPLIRVLPARDIMSFASTFLGCSGLGNLWVPYPWKMLRQLTAAWAACTTTIVTVVPDRKKTLKSEER